MTNANAAMELCISWGYKEFITHCYELLGNILGISALIVSVKELQVYMCFYCKIMIPQVYKLTENYVYYYYYTCASSIAMNIIQHATLEMWYVFHWL